jgi:hypothetical protein
VVTEAAPRCRLWTRNDVVHADFAFDKILGKFAVKDFLSYRLQYVFGRAKAAGERTG